MGRYSNIEVLKSKDGERYFKNNTYPIIPYSDNDIYVITTAGDRLDLLAYDYYKDVSLWWIIASANSLPGDSLFIPLGSQIRIPINLDSVLIDYKIFNNKK